MGYRVARHLSDLTVTSYERQIRLDQHLDQRNTYSFTTSESELPRPDLPPKTVVELPENIEISLESSSLIASVESSITTEDKSDNTAEEKSEKQPVQKSVEVIDVLDSSDEASSDESFSDNSDVEIIHESAPNTRNKGRNFEVVDVDNESDVEVIEVLVPKKEIIVETIDSSDSEEEQSSDSGSDKSHDGNWKRKSNNNKNRYQRPSIMNHYRFLSAQEFCVEKSKSKKSQQVLQSMSFQNNESVNVNEISDDPECGNCSGTEPIVNRAARPKFIVEKSRIEILDLMPSMGGHKRKLLAMSAPDLRLIPENIIPKQQSYTFSMNTLKARVFKPSFRGRFRGFNGPRYGNFNSYSNNPVQGFYPNQMNSMSSFTPNPALAQMFGSDIHSMARGMMQFASSLLLSLPQNNQTNSLLPFAQQPLPIFHGRNSNYSQPDSSPRIHGAFEPRNSSYSNSSYNSFNSGINRNTQQFRSNNFPPVHNQDNVQRSPTPYSRLSDTDFSERNFTPPPRPTNIQRINSYMPNRVCSRNAFRRNHSRQRASLPPRPTIPLRTEDPAYMKPDVPFCGNPNLPQERLDNSIPLRRNSNVEMEIVQVIGDGNSTPQKRTGTKMSKRKRKNRQKRKLNKKMCFDTQVRPVIIILDSPLSNNSSADLIEVKHQANDVPSENNTSESGSGQNLEVKQESSEDSLEIKTEQTTLTIVKNEQSMTETSVKSENCCDISVKPEKNESGSNSQTEIKTESSSSNSTSVSIEPVSIEPLVKLESNISFKSEPNVKLEESNTKHENSCHSQDITPVNSDEVDEEKLENLSDLVSENNVDRTVNATVSQQDKEVAKGTSISTSSVIQSEVSLSAGIQNNVNLQPFGNEMEVEESDELSRNTSEITSSALIKNMNSEDNEVSLSNVSSWAEVKKHNIPISNLPESISDKESDSDDKDENDSDEIKPLIRPKHCRTIGNYDSFSFYL